MFSSLYESVWYILKGNVCVHCQAVEDGCIGRLYMSDDQETSRGESPHLEGKFCTYDTFIVDDLTIDMISCQEQLSTRDGTSRHKYYV